jgi:hypothetical protein
MKREIVPVAQIAQANHFLRGQKVMLDFDLAVLYGVTTGNLNKALKQNSEWLPADFTEQGVAMLSSVLKSGCAVKVNIAIMHAFAKLRATLETSRELAEKFAKLEEKGGKNDDEISAIIDAVRQLMVPPNKPAREIGFHVQESSPRYGRRTRR